MDDEVPFNSSMVKRNDAFSYLEGLKDLFSGLTVIETGMNPSYRHDSSIKAVLFDIYGTLLISEAGDIGLTRLDDESTVSFVIELKTGSEEFRVSRIKSILADLIARHHSRIRENCSGIDYPEVDIIVLWHEIFQELGFENYGIEELYRNALRFEILSNRVCLMPGLRSLFRSLQKRKIPQGIVSNAQFYTPLILEFLTGMTLRELGFRREFSAWSFELKRGKPDAGIFDSPLKALNRAGFQNSEILYVGNDMLNDIASASALGMKTALFAGDRRSLRLREGDPRIAGVVPDHIITELKQLKPVLGVGTDG